jgi:hypothetical protein
MRPDGVSDRDGMTDGTLFARGRNDMQLRQTGRRFSQGMDSWRLNSIVVDEANQG